MATPVSELDLPTLEPELMMALKSSPAGSAPAVAAMTAIREESWLAKGLFGYVVTRYDDAVAILRDRRFHQAASLIPQMQGIDPARMGPPRTSILTAEGDEHSRLRRIVAPAFTPKAVDRFRPYMREVITSILDDVLARPTTPGRIELVADVCEPYPIPIICKLLGVPSDDWKLFSVWATDLLRIFNGNLAEDLPFMMAARQNLEGYLRPVIEARRGKPGDDLLTDLITAEEAGDRLSTDELAMLAEAVLVAGTDTTRNQLACTVAYVLSQPKGSTLWRRLADEPGLAATVVEETMRLFGSVRATVRFASEDIDYRDVLFPKGTIVSVSFGSANRDETRFADSERFDPERRSDVPHTSFGSGIHYCLGAALARAELQEALPVLASRLPDLRLDGDVTWKPPMITIWGPERLPLRYG